MTLHIFGGVSLPDLSRRSSEPEFMDAPDFSGDLLAESFAFIRLVNLLGGGQHAVRQGLKTLLRSRHHGRPLKVLDVGCGVGDIGLGLVNWGRAHGLPIHYLGLEQNERILDLARRSNHDADIRFRQGSLTADDVPAADVIIASMVFHHFDDEAIVTTLRHLHARARLGLIVNDLERSLPAYLAAWLVTRPLRHPAAQSDALLSVRKGFRPAELETLIARAGLNGTVRPALGFRVLAVVPVCDES
jgi:2-polyprenyl-3-methyl-5-hydroxy-6-metoxy-1,4-benzoquinol methylase